jgi:hypothetical protein
MVIWMTMQRAQATLIGLMLFSSLVAAQPGVATPPKATPQPPSTSGRVVDVTGVPLRSAPGVIFAASVIESFSSEFITDREGNFKLEQAPKSPFHLAVFPAELTPKAPAPRLLKDRAALDLAPIKLDQGVSVSARLIDQDGEPVPGTIRFLSLQGVELPDLLKLRETVARADASGRVAFNSPPGAQVFFAEGPEHIGERFERRVVAKVVTTTPPTATAETASVDLGTVTLKRGLTLRGLIVNDLGEPLEGVILQTFLSQSSQTETFMARSKEGGRFELLGLREGSVLVSARLKGYHFENADFQAGDQDVSIVMARWGALAGRVVDDLGNPLSGARINFGGAGKLKGRALGGTLAKAADFKLEGLPPFTGHLRVTVPGFRPKTLEDVSVSSGQTTELGDVALDKGRTVEGRVVDAKGTAVPEARIEAWPTGTYERSRTAANLRGEFSLSGLSSGPLEVEAQAVGYGPARTRVEIDSAEDPDPLRIVLEKGAQLAGSVKTRRGVPVAGLIVQLRSKGDGSFSKQASTDATGSFEIKDVPAANLLLTVMASAGDAFMGMGMRSFSTVALRELQINVGQTRRVDLTLREIEVSGRVSGVSAPETLRVTFMNARGSVIGFGDGRVGGTIPSSSGLPRFAAPVDSAGAFRLVVDEPGSYNVVVESLIAPRAARLRQAVEIPELPPDVNEFAVDLTVTQIRMAGVIMEKGNERPVPGARLSAQAPDTATGATAQRDGRFEIFVPPGPLDVVITADGFNRRELKMTASEPLQEQKFEISRSTPTEETTLSGQVRLPSGEPASLAMLRAIPLDRDASFSLAVQADAAGRFAWTDAVSGRYVVWAFLGAERIGHVIGETGNSVEVTLGPAVAVTSAVVDSAGSPLTDAGLRVLSVDDLPLLSTVRLGPGFLPPGRVVLRGQTETHTGVATVDVRPGEPTSVVVVATPKPKAKPLIKSAEILPGDR